MVMGASLSGALTWALSFLIFSHIVSCQDVDISAPNITVEEDVSRSFLLLNSAFGILKDDSPAQAFDLPIGTCNAQTPCANGACCSSVTGLCGYSPAECGAGNCSSNCDAKAECGQYGVPGKQNCPLNVCCSEFGFCGSEPDFCGTGCQKGFGTCGSVKKPTCSKDGGSVEGRYIGYYESWANTRECSAVAPEDLNLDGLTHLNFAFVFFDPNTFEIVPMDKNAGELLHRFTALKEMKSGLQTWVSVGGWSFNDPGPWQQAFSNMASTAANRRIFINNLIRFMDTYGFDGMDLDWEYPTADDRGGRAEDTANFVLLSKDIKAAFKGKYGYTITLPASYWYLQHFDIAEHQKYVDWFNLMSYDLHGVWDAASKWIGPKIAPHTNITEIDAGLDLLWRAGLKPENLVLGQGFYGRSFTLSDPSCNKPNGICTFSDGAREGPCSKASGILTLQEIQEIIIEKDLKPVHDKKAGVKWIHWDNDQWVSYDDAETLQQKKEFANSRCLGGLMIWALDQVDPAEKSLIYPQDWTEDEIAEAEMIYQDEAAQGVCYTTKCNEKCSPGEYEASQMNGQPGQLSTYDRCDKGEFRRLCCAKGTIMGKCQWRGYRGLGLACSGGCADGETEITQNTNHHSDKEDQSCAGGTQSYCCAGFKAPITKEQVKDEFKDQAKDLAMDAAEAAAIELAAKAFCRVAITAALTPLTFIPFVGWIIRLAIQAAVPALANVCAKGIAKTGKSVFKYEGKEYTIPLDKPLTTKKDRGPSASPTKPPSKTQSCAVGGNALDKRARRLKDKSFTKTVTQNPPLQVPPKTKTCDYAKHGQACLHYNSVINRNPAHASLTCGVKRAVGDGNIREVVYEYYNDKDKGHHKEWRDGWMQAPNVNCQADEFPPAIIWQARNKDVWIRLSPGSGNMAAGQLFKGCPAKPRFNIVQPARQVRVLKGCNRDTTIYEVKVQMLETVIAMSFDNMPNLPDDGIPANPCYPKVLVDDPGYALRYEDAWYNAHSGNKKYRKDYPNPPGAVYTNGKTRNPGWNKRHLDPEDIYVDLGNSSRPLTDEELLEDFDLLKCDGDCQEEMEALGYASLPVADAHTATPVAAEAATTTAAAMGQVGGGNAAVVVTGDVSPQTTLSSIRNAATRVVEAAEAVVTASVKYALMEDLQPQEQERERMEVRDEGFGRGHGHGHRHHHRRRHHG